ncbi:MAG: hypothetical protein KDK55_00670 [Chlamydiia bacterium]|nr:hypothetical protein [Chlamydiia bacterium]
MMFTIFEQMLIYLPLIIGAYITISLLKLPDFSIESAYLFGAVMALLFHHLFFFFLGAIFGGMIVGASVNLLNQWLKLPFLLSAIIVNGVFHGTSQYLMGTSIKSFHPHLNVPELVLFISVALLILIVIGFFLRSQLGYSLSIYGNNPRFFFHQNISGTYVASVGIMIGHGCAGLSGFLFVLSNDFVDVTMNVGVILLCLTALLLGKLIIPTKKPIIFIPLLGALGYFTIQQTILRLGFDLKYFNTFQSLFILFAILVGYKKQNRLIDHLGV